MPNGLKTALLLGFLSGLLLAIGELLGGVNGLAIAFVFAAILNFGSYWFSDRIVLRMYRAEEVSSGHRLYGVVERLSRQAGLPMPRVYVIPDPSPNAFATGRNPQHAAVAATEGILRHLRACDRMDVNPEVAAVREIIDDALNGRRVFAESVTMNDRYAA